MNVDQGNKDNKNNKNELYNQYDQNEDSVSKLEIDTLFLTDKVRIINDKVRKTPWYKVITHLKLYIELRGLVKEADDIDKRLEKLERAKRNPIQIVKRT